VSGSKPGDAGVAASDLYRATDLSGLGIETTDDLEDVGATVGQERAVRALSFGVGMDREGFHIFALGPENAQKKEIVSHLLRERAADEPPPPDLCYVNDFDHWHRPAALRLPPGKGRELAHDMDGVLEGLPSGLRASFESEEYQTRRQALAEAAGEEHQEAFDALRTRARERDLALLRTPGGFVFAPVRDGEVLSPDEAEALSDEERERIEKHIEELQEELGRLLRKVPGQQRELQRRLRELNREVAELTVRDHLEQIREKYGEFGEVRAFLDAVQDDVVEHVQAILGADGGQEGQEGDRRGRSRSQVAPGSGASGVLERPELRRYRVNVVVDNGASEHAPVVYEDHPTYQHLVGRVEYASVMGTLVTDFNLVKAGALHRANGGYLVLNIHRVLRQPLAWEGLKRALKSGELRVESPQQSLGMVTTVSLEPEAVPLDVKVVLMGSPLMYYLLSELDPDFPQLFKVAADFEDRMGRSSDEEAVYARLLATLVRRERLRPFSRTALERVMEWGARRLGDAERLSVEVDQVLDLMREADHWCGEDGADVVTDAHVRQAEDEGIQRLAKVRDRIHEEILRRTLLVDTRGRVTGQVNGLSVLSMGGFSFGRPNRITAQARMGKGEVVDIEREVELGGPIHAKGVLILSAFLGARYARTQPLSLSASLVFEQSYSGVEGDSASVAELCALLSVLSGIPIRQSMGITGSVNQRGQVQAIGGVNQKIEGFFDIWKAGLESGDEAADGDEPAGVIIPRSNLKHLMLRSDVIEAVEEGRFHVWPVEHVDEAVELLMGRPAGERDDEGRFPDGSVNQAVEVRLHDFAAGLRRFQAAGE
jgi:lon-related putative ATP-dependent protease